MPVPDHMSAVLLTGHGGLEKLEYRTDIAVPEPGPHDVLIALTAAGINNTDVNTRIGWYDQSVITGTTDDSAGDAADDLTDDGDRRGGWTDGLAFPRIQGADAVGHIAAVGDAVDPTRIGEHVIVAPYFTRHDNQAGAGETGFLGSEYDGAFAQFVAVPSTSAVAINPVVQIEDTALATLPCSGGTAMNMALMAGIDEGDVVLVTGASGGVGTFLVQIARHKGATVIALASTSKTDMMLSLGADAVVPRETGDLVGAVLAATGGRPLSVVADVVGGDRFVDYLTLLGRQGRYVTAGAIAGPLVTLDLRTLYLKSLAFYGSSIYRPDTFPALMRVVEDGGVNPIAAAVYPLSDIREAQTAFLKKTHVGSLVLVPPGVGEVR